MSTKVTRRNTLYGYPNPQAGLQQEPLVMQRDPMVSDAAEVGTIWCNTESQSYWILTASQGGVNTWTSSTGGAETVTSLTVDPGDITVTDGDINVDTGNVTVAGTITGGAIISASIDVPGALEVTGSAIITGTEDSVGAVTLNSDGGTASTLVIENQTGTTDSAITITSQVGGTFITADTNFKVEAGAVAIDSVVDAISISSATTLDIDADTSVTITTPTLKFDSADISAVPDEHIVASPTSTATSNNNMVVVSFTGFTTAAGASQVFTIDNSQIVSASAVFVTAANLGANDAKMTVTRVLTATGSVAITLTNNGTQALDGTVNITLWLVLA